MTESKKLNSRSKKSNNNRSNKKYSQNDFKNDLRKLENMLGGKKKRVAKKSASKKVKKVGMKKRSGMKKRTGMKKRVVMKKKVAVKKRSGMKKRRTMKGGKKDASAKYRHFKVVELNGKKVDFGEANIKLGRNPSAAAKKLLRSIARHMGVKGMNRLGLKVRFCIYETTRDLGKHKTYCYSGSYEKLNPDEVKSATFAGIKRTMRPVVKKVKMGASANAQKGGK